MYKKILVPLDGSGTAERILPYVRLLASTYQIPVELLRVVDPDVRPAFWPPAPARDYLRRAAESCLPAPLEVTCVDESGVPDEVIVERAKLNKDCLVAMATHGLSGVRRWLLGSVTTKVVHRTRNPLLLIHPRDDPPSDASMRFDSIVVPLDGSGLAEKVLPHARSLAQKFKSEIHLVRVFSLPTQAYLVNEGAPLTEIAEQREVIEKEVKEYIEGERDELQADGFRSVAATALEGDAAGEIVDFVNHMPNSLIMIASHGRAGLDHFFLGSVAERVIQHTTVPVFVIRPEE